MYRKGHLGVSLIVFAPLGYALLRGGEGSLAFLAGAVMLGLSSLPDVDHRVPGLSHRGLTHTVAFALVVGCCLGAVGFAVDPAADPTGSRLAVFGFLVGVLSVLAHLLGDVLTPMGVRPFWPLSGRTFSLRLARADNALANDGLFALGVFVTAAAAWLAIAT
ncbi:MAG: metal-dependent hydrolase [Salinigranum sp.]